MIPSSYPSIVIIKLLLVEHQSVVVSPISATHTYFSITVSDGTQTSSLTQSILGIYPYFYGFSEQLIINVNAMVGLTKEGRIQRR
jgi:hypothetical protein